MGVSSASTWTVQTRKDISGTRCPEAAPSSLICPGVPHGLSSEMLSRGGHLSKPYIQIDHVVAATHECVAADALPHSHQQQLVVTLFK